MSTQSTLTITGFVGSSVRFTPAKDGGIAYASFRLGSTPRIYDRAAQAWRDGATQWFTVKVWRNVADNVAASLRKGDPVVVVGKLSLDQWESPDGPRSTLVLAATALGHDLMLGRTHFTRVLSGGSGPAEGAPDEAAPADVSGLTELADPDDDDVEIDEDDLDDLDELADAALAG